MSVPSPKICRRIRSHFLMIGSSNANEATTAREKLVKLLTEHALTWNDIPACIAAADEDDRVRAGQRASHHGPPSSTTGLEVNPFEVIHHLVELHIAITPEERAAITLWILHTYIFDRYSVTPRLALLSPVRGCGKTTLLVLLDVLTKDPDRADNVTAASLYYELDRGARTLLLDEGDNLGLLHNPVLRTVLNGNRRGSHVKRFIAGRSRRYPTFTPLAIAAIGMLPLPLMRRAVVINMQRSSAPMARLDELSPAFSAVRVEIGKWVTATKLNPEPDMPPALSNFTADNWRPLIAIADDLGYGEIARLAAVALTANRPDEDPGVILLGDIRAIFGRLGVDRLTSKVLIEALLALDDALWADWRGPNDDRPPRKLNQSDMARLLRPFGIRPRTIRLGLQQTNTARGYLREQFETAWAAYCPPSDTPTQASNVISLPRAGVDT